jgi:hypothetical protein
MTRTFLETAASVLPYDLLRVFSPQSGTTGCLLRSRK